MSDKIKKTKKVAICGTAPSIKQAPFGDANFDIWGVAHCCFLKEVTRLDRIFEIHSKEIWVKDNAPFQRFPNAILYFQEKDEKWSNSRTFPLKPMLEKYKVNKGFDNEANYFSSSIPYMICMAIDEGYEEIHVYGIHLLQDEEYFYQRPCAEFWLGVAQGKGIKVYMPPAADLLKFPYLYGYQEEDGETKKIEERIKEFDSRLSALQNNKDQFLSRINGEMNQLMGAKEDCKYFLRHYCGKENR